MGGELFTDFSGSFTDNEYFNKQINVLVRNLTKLRIHPSTPLGESLNKHHKISEVSPTLSAGDVFLQLQSQSESPNFHILHQI